MCQLCATPEKHIRRSAVFGEYVAPAGAAPLVRPAATWPFGWWRGRQAQTDLSTSIGAAPPRGYLARKGFRPDSPAPPVTARPGSFAYWYCGKANLSLRPLPG